MAFSGEKNNILSAIEYLENENVKIKFIRGEENIFEKECV